MHRNKKVMIVDDDINICELISVYLNKEGYETKKYLNGRDAIREFPKETPDLIILDIMLPELDGYEICKEIRKMSDVPIIMVTAKGETFDKVLGLELGADDYLVKPFDSKELLARVKAVLRRYKSKNSNNRIVVLPNLSVDISNYSIVYHGNRMELPPKELELLFYLVSNPNRVFTREQLLEHIWSFDYMGETRTVDVHIKRLREKFYKDDDWEIKTVWGVGYKFQLN